MICGTHAASHWSPLVTRDLYGAHLVCMSSQKLGVTKLNDGRVLLLRSSRRLWSGKGATLQLVPVMQEAAGSVMSLVAQVLPPNWPAMRRWLKNTAGLCLTESFP